MGVITLKIDDRLEAQLRKRAGELHGASKGAISKSVEEAISSWLSAPPRRPVQRIFTAILNGEKVAEEQDLRRLADDLRHEAIDPRAVEIRCSPAPPSAVRLGLRSRPSPA